MFKTGWNFNYNFMFMKKYYFIFSLFFFNSDNITCFYIYYVLLGSIGVFSKFDHHQQKFVLTFNIFKAKNRKEISLFILSE